MYLGGKAELLSNETRVIWYDYNSTVINTTATHNYFETPNIKFRVFRHYDGPQECLELQMHGIGGSFNFAFLQQVFCNESRYYACIRQIPEIEGKIL